MKAFLRSLVLPAACAAFVSCGQQVARQAQYTPMTPEQTVQMYYSDLNARRFHQAFNLLGPSWRDQLTYARWVSSFGSTLSQRAAVSSASDGRYDVSLLATDQSQAGPLITRYSGSWKLIPNHRGGWLLDDPDFSRGTSSYFNAQNPMSEPVEDTYAKLKQSLAFVFAATDEGIVTGSAFCVYSTQTESYFLTNHHVIDDSSDIRLALVSQGGNVYRARVVSLSSTLDAALLAVDTGGTPALVLAAELPPEGRSIGVAGYPVIQVELAMANLGFNPSLHEGTVSALAGNQYVEYDAQTDHGNSGGPMFDSETGVVYGMVTYGVQSPESSSVQDNLAIPATQLLDFLNSADIAPLVAQVTGPPGSTAQPAPGASVAAADAGSSSPTQVVQQYYSLWNEKDYAGMYALLSMHFQQLHPYASYPHYHSFTDSITADVTPGATTSDVNFRISSTDHNESGTVSHSAFVGTWHLVWENGGWKLDSQDIHQIPYGTGSQP